jgi:hypothetical protein
VIDGTRKYFPGLHWDTAIVGQITQFGRSRNTGIPLVLGNTDGVDLYNWLPMEYH